MSVCRTPDPATTVPSKWEINPKGHGDVDQTLQAIYHTNIPLMSLVSRRGYELVLFDSSFCFLISRLGHDRTLLLLDDEYVTMDGDPLHHKLHVGKIPPKSRRFAAAFKSL